MSYVAKYQRVATISGNYAIGGTNQADHAQESGRLYLVSAACTVTLPAVRDGAYYKFVVKQDITSASALIINAVAGEDMAGSIRVHVEGSSGNAAELTAIAQADPADGHDKLTIGGGSNALHAGSWVECFSDGTYWYLYGDMWANNDAVVATFGDQ